MTDTARSTRLSRRIRRLGTTLLSLAAACAGTQAAPATVTVAIGQSIQSGINQAAAGDTVVVAASTRYESIVIDRSITVQANGVVTLRPGGYSGISIQCSSCSVIGFTFENFEQAAAASLPRNNVTLRDLTFRNVGAGIWVDGNNWTVERVTINPFRCRDGEDYMNAFGSGHVFRRLFFAGLRIPEDIGPRADGSYKHSDLIQCWTAGGTAGLKNTIVEECIFTDFAEGVYFHNETGVQDGINGNIVRNNVFWGTDFASEPGTNLVGGPVHTTRFTGPSSSPGTIRNNLYFNTVLGITLDGVPGVSVNGNIILNSGAAFGLQNMSTSGVNRGTLGNVLWQNDWNGSLSQGPDKYIDPQLRDVNSLLGPDGVPWTLDDGWRPMNPAAAAYGPQTSLVQAVDPSPPDADQDLLVDSVETDTGTFVDENDTGTDPADPDSDDDGVLDGIEVSLGTDPNNVNDFPVLSLNTAVQILGIALAALAATRHSNLWPKSRL